MTHTPGNWTAAKDSRAHQGAPERTDWLIWQTDADGKLAHTEPIAQVFDYLHPGEGNARLIALAPKLLKVCERALALLGDFESDHDGGVILELRELIAEATGE